MVVWCAWITNGRYYELLSINPPHQENGSIEVELEGPYFYSYLRLAFEAGEMQYWDSPSFRWMHCLGEALQQGWWTSTGFIKNVHRSHWVATVIDFSKKAILYGDSLLGQLDIESTMIMQWWTEYHAGTWFELSKLANCLQNDSFSYGILSTLLCIYQTSIHW